MEITLRVQVEKTSGVFCSKDAIGEEIAGLIDGQSLSVDDSQYEVVEVTVG